MLFPLFPNKLRPPYPPFVFVRDVYVEAKEKYFKFKKAASPILVVTIITTIFNVPKDFIDRGVCFPGQELEYLAANGRTMHSCVHSGLLWYEVRDNLKPLSFYFPNTATLDLILQQKETH